MPPGYGGLSIFLEEMVLDVELDTHELTNVELQLLQQYSSGRAGSVCQLIFL